MINQKEFNQNLMVVIVSYFPSQEILNNIVKLEQECNEILIVDNGSDGGSLDLIKELEKREKVTVHYCNENLGIAAALNIGLNYAYEKKYDWLLTFDQDSVIITENYAYTLYQTTLQEFGLENVAVIGGNYPKPINIYNPDENRYPEATGIIKAREVNTVITSGNLLNLVQVKETNVYFNDALFIDYVDFDFCLTLKDKGKRIIQVLEGKFEHQIGDPMIRKYKNKYVYVMNHNHIRKYYIIRNSYIIHKKFINRNADWVKYSKGNLKKLVKYTLLFEKNRPRKLLYMLKGYFDGYRGKVGKI